MNAPKIDARSYQQIVDEAEHLAEELTGKRWRRGQPQEPGGALIRIFGRFAELLIERLNQVPEKNFLAFLNLIGTSILPPQPARVPLTFQLAAGSPVDAFVPAATQAAAPPSDDLDEEVIFETDLNLVVTRSRLVEVFVRNLARLPNRDRYRRVTDQALGTVDAPFAAFEGEQDVEHTLFIACEALLKLTGATNDLTVTFYGAQAARLQALPLSWAYHDGTRWQSLAPSAVVSEAGDAARWAVTVKGLPPLGKATVNGLEGGWLRAQLALPLPPPQSGIALDAVALGEAGQPQDLRLPLTPFGDAAPETICYLSGDEAFRWAGSTVTLDVQLERPGVGANLVLRWEYEHTEQRWVELGQSTSGGDSAGNVVDGTAALSRAGQLRLHVPADRSWDISEHQGRSGRWLRLSIIQGSYSQRPRIAALSASYDWNLPQVERIRISPPGTRPTLPLAHAFREIQTLDTSKDFSPFGDEPRSNDSFYLAYDPALDAIGAVPGDTIKLDLTLSQAGVVGGSPSRSDPAAAGSTPLELAWEFWNGQSWTRLDRAKHAFGDGSEGFTKTPASLSFVLPADAAPTTVNGVDGHWLRARIVKGNYGVGAGYKEENISVAGSNLPFYRPIAANYRPPIIQSLTLGVSGAVEQLPSACLAYNDFVYADQTQAARSQRGTAFAPFTPASDSSSALYLGFDQPFDSRTVTLYIQAEPPLPDEVTFAALGHASAQAAPQLTWEYSGPDGGWAPLWAFDETSAFSRRGLLRFAGPADFSPRGLFGHSLYWLRARWYQGSYPLPPRLRRLLLNTTWASQATTIQNVILGSGNGEAGQRLQLAQVPVLAGQQIEIREPELLPEDERAALCAVEGADAINITLDASGQPLEIWVRWHEVPDFYGSRPRDRHYTLDRLSGELRFGDGQYGLLPPIGQNNIRVARYRSGGGPQGNRPAGSIVQLKSSLPYVDSVTNPEGASGGAARESLDSVKRYGPRQLRHRGRAVTYEDFEDLAYAASPEVARAHAVPPRFDPLSLWIEPQDTRPDTSIHADLDDAGRLRLIIVPRDDSPRPTPSLGLLELVRSALLARCVPTADLQVTGPDWVEVVLSVSFVPISLQQADLVGARISAALERFLHPLNGGPLGKGWPFGRRPWRSDLFALLEGVEGIDHIRTLEVLKPAAETELPALFLIYSGQHHVRLALEA